MAEFQTMEILIKSRWHYPPELYINGVPIKSAISSTRMKLTVIVSQEEFPTIMEESAVFPSEKFDS